MNNLEKLLIFASDQEFADDLIASTERLLSRSSNSNKSDVKRIKDKLKNIKKLCLEKQ